MTQIIKQAALLDAFFGGAIETVANKVDFKNKPFETLFGTLVPAVAFSFSPLLGIFLSFVAAYGDDTSAIGATIDRALGFGENKEPPKEITDSDITSAADQVTNKYFDQSKLPDIVNDTIGWGKELFGTQTATAMLNDIRMIKGSISENDIFVAAAYAECQLVKTAYGRSWWQKLLGIGKNPHSVRKSGISGILGWIIKKVLQTVGGIIGLGVAGGAIAAGKDLLGIEQYKSKPTPTKTNYPMPETLNIGGNIQSYMNTQRDVLKTMIDFLNAEFQFDSNGQKVSFTDLFHKKYNIPIETSPQMKKLLKNIMFMNGGGSLEYISSWRAFNAPDMDAVFKLFFPGLPIPSAVPETTNTSIPNSKPKKDSGDLEEMMKQHWTTV